MKYYDEKKGYDKYAYRIDCQSKVLTWVAISFFNYYAFIWVLTWLSYITRFDSPRHRKMRFNLVRFMSFLFVPFMFGWNIYGNRMIK